MYWFWLVATCIKLVKILSTTTTLFEWSYTFIKTLSRDICLLVLYVRLSSWTKQCAKENRTMYRVFSKLLEAHPKKAAFYFENETWTFEQVQEFSNKVSNYFITEGYQRGDVIGLLLENCAEYPIIWLGLSKIGLVTALINTNLSRGPLLHCIANSSCKGLIYGASHTQAVSDISGKSNGIKFYQFGKTRDEEQTLLGSIDLIESLNDVSEEYKPSTETSHKDPVLYIYTSGTTGLPKAAVFSHLRILTAIKSYANVAGMTSDDVLYTPLPLYHSAGGVVGVGQAFVSGTTVTIRKKFSASNYFRDCATYNATVGQYVGEMCRYILATPKTMYDNHPLRVLLGNGLKPAIWRKLVKRFNIHNVIEFYGATEGIANMCNIDGTIGAVGIIPRYLKWVFPITNIKCDPVSGEPIRNKTGNCIECGVGEPGLLVSKVISTKSMYDFEGYADKKESNKKIIHDVFRKGDAYFNSGDILSYDAYGYYYFKDRTGDTFRWKGENVSTSEVETVISSLAQLSDVAVYGVQVPHTEGRAGMAAIAEPNQNLVIETFGKCLKLHLPTYALPVFLRIMKSLPVTGTYKLKKTDLKEDGFNIYTIKDELYFHHPKLGKYVPLTEGMYKELEEGNLKI